jgi:hypothetical protein
MPGDALYCMPAGLVYVMALQDGAGVRFVWLAADLLCSVAYHAVCTMVSSQIPHSTPTLRWLFTLRMIVYDATENVMVLHNAPAGVQRAWALLPC